MRVNIDQDLCAMPEPWSNNSFPGTQSYHVNYDTARSVVFDSGGQNVRMPDAADFISAMPQIPQIPQTSQESINSSSTNASVTTAKMAHVELETYVVVPLSEELESLRDAANATPSIPAKLNFAKKLLELINARYDIYDLEQQKALIAEADRWIRYLCQRNIPEALYIKAIWHQHGLMGYYENKEEWHSQMSMAARLGHAEACLELGKFYEEKNDGGKAVGWYKKAAEKFLIPACHLKEKRSKNRALEYLRIAVNQPRGPESCESLYLLGQLLCGQHPQVQLDADKLEHREAFFYFQSAASFGHKEAQYQLGCCFEKCLLGCKYSPKDSMEWYKSAAAQGNSESQVAAACWLARGAPGVFEANAQEAFEWCKRAVDTSNLSSAQLLLGYYYEKGIGGSIDKESAEEMYLLAARNGSPIAKERLKTFNLKPKNINGKRRLLTKSDDCITQ